VAENTDIERLKTEFKAMNYIVHKVVVGAAEGLGQSLADEIHAKWSSSSQS
jgi:hypothetical protein